MPDAVDDASSAGLLTWRTVLAESAERLRSAGVEHADSDARRIVEEASGHEGAALALHIDEPVTERQITYHDDILARRAGGEPLQYALGRWGFRHLDLAVDRRVLIPRPETEQVVEVGLTELDRLGVAHRELHVVDLGTGSGAIALSIATERVRTRVWAVDISSDALALARANLVGIGRPATRVRMLEGRWFEPLPSELRGEVGLVISNPPYVPDATPLPSEVEEWEPRIALRAGPDGLDDIAEIVAEAGEWLMADGALVVEIDPSQAAAAMQLAESAGFRDVTVAPDLSSRARALRARRPG